MVYKGLYGQPQGNEHRQATQALWERYADNDIVEGEPVALMRVFMKDKRWNAMATFCEKLRKDGFSQSRIDSMLNRAGMRIRL